MKDTTPLKWPPETHRVYEGLKRKITELLDNPHHSGLRESFDEFMEILHQTPDGSISVTRDEAIGFFATYLMTKPVQDAVFRRLQENK